MKMVTFRHSDWIFVFSSNIAGKHGKGAAKDAKDYFGAKYGVGEGFSGRSYAIPTKDKSIQSRDIEAVRRSIVMFLKVAEQRQDITFMVTRIGYGLAGFNDKEISEIFEDCSPNVLMPRKWYQCLGKTKKEFRVILAGNASLNHYATVKEKMDKLLSAINVPIRIISGTNKGIDQCAERYAQENGYTLARFESNTTMFGTAAPKLLNETLAWYSDALCVFWNESCPDTNSMLEIAERENILIRETVFSN